MCDYPDNVAYCDKQTESVVGFKCPAPHELPPNAVARRFLPFPRFPKPGDETAYIVVSQGVCYSYLVIITCPRAVCGGQPPDTLLW